jgi:hypothetical protein
LMNEKTIAHSKILLRQLFPSFEMRQYCKPFKDLCQDC